MVLPPAIAGVLAGVWVLLNNTPTDLNGVPQETRPFVGLITYLPSGYMSANLASTESDKRPRNLTYPAKDGQPDSDWALVGKNTLAYAGNCSVEPWSTTTNGTLIHGPLLVADVPSWEGTNQTRNYEVTKEGNKTVLRLWIHREGSETIGNLYWAKLAPLV
ncbi:hypothetical protein DM02DRAFT_655792 [Periconia macrospinosa]|uniref:Lipocalin-like domain-containing protein n=1 Tax=Periconia macrospinosa TaxID=97972 RepID=A0A2V1DRS6_9PLEO|nr:hypothetical protein DM02DRAFT_655792 [Periconia macrospinosa]